MDSVRETMERVYALIEKHGPRLAGASCMAIGNTREIPYVRNNYTPEQRAQAEEMLKAGNPPRQTATALDIKYQVVLRWSLKLGLRWPRYGWKKRVYPKEAA